MQIVVRSPAGEQELDVALRDPEATVAELLHAVLGEQVPASCRVAGREVARSSPLADSGLHDGAVLEVGAGPAVTVLTGLELVVVGGLHAGAVLPVPPGRSALGRGPGRLAVPGRTVSRTHAHLDVVPEGLRVVDAGSANGTRVDGEVLVPGSPVVLRPGQLMQVGTVGLRVRPTSARTARSGRVDRPPRGPRPAPPEPLAVPVRTSPPTAAPFGVATFAGGLVLAGLLVALSGQLQYAAFSLAMPLLAVGSWYESRRRARTGAARADREHARALEELRCAVVAAGAAERDRLRALAPDLAEALRRAAEGSPLLWERRPDDDDALNLQLGTADLPWLPPLDAPAPACLDDVVVPAAPVVVDLSQGGVVGLVGDRAAALAGARSLLLQAAVQQGPADLVVAVVVAPGREAAWDWVKWLPHTRVAGSPGRRWLAATLHDAAELLPDLPPGALLVLDGDAGARPTSRAARGLVLAGSRDRLPASCTTVVEVLDEDGTALVTDVATGRVVTGIVVGGTDATTARSGALDLARFEDPEVHAAGAGLPAEVRLLPLLGLDDVDGPAVLARWHRSGGAPVTPLGVTASGRLVLDLVRDGAHGLVGGTTGSGKSELLRTLVAGLAATCSPDDLVLVLVDYKGGAAFDACARLPHVVGLVTDLDEQLGSRALTALEAELQTRERLLRSVGADDLAAYRARASTPLPRLLVVVDEFATLAAELPDFVSALVGIAQRGRTLGVHLLLATQRPSGAVKDDIRANTNLRIALRVQDAADSSDVVGAPDAAALSRTTPGRALVRLGPGELVPVQTALVTCVSGGEAARGVDASPFLFGPVSRAPDPAPAAADHDAPTDLARLVDAVVHATALAGCAPARRPWPEPLPPDLDLAALPPREGVAVVALADDPRRQRQEAVGWDPSSGGLLLCGVPGSGTTTALASLALALAAGRPPDRLELQVLDAGAGDLSALAGLPHTGSVVPLADRERTARLLRWL
ncbi:MAG: putative FtsK/SpoIIIE family protein, partial [Frankiales bacterium]|nr:putative FtsK/SpoIIIE family protein [Frankiales bacterium]